MIIWIDLQLRSSIIKRLMDETKDYQNLMKSLPRNLLRDIMTDIVVVDILGKYAEGVTVYLHDAKGITDRLLGRDMLGIVPEHVIPVYCEAWFPDMYILDFMTIVAAHTSRPVVYEELANEAGISAPTAKKRLSILVSSHIIVLVQPYHNNALKRVVKMPLLHFTDTGLVDLIIRLRHGGNCGTIYPTLKTDEYRYGKQLWK